LAETAEQMATTSLRLSRASLQMSVVHGRMVMQSPWLSFVP
jgi:hypothetical protein